MPQETCCIPRSRFGLVWPFPLVLVVFSEKCRFLVKTLDVKSRPETQRAPIPGSPNSAG